MHTWAKFRMNPCIEVGDKLWHKVPPIIGSALFESMRQMSSGNSRDCNGATPEIEIVFGNQGKSSFHRGVKRIAIDASSKSPIRGVAGKGHLLGDSHGVDYPPVARCLWAFAASTDNPVTFRCHLDEISSSGMTELAIRQRA
jgi:hypothetical protein